MEHKRKKKGSKIGLILLAAVLLIVAFGAFYVMGEMGGKDGGEEVQFTVEMGQSQTAIAQNLEDAGIIKNAFLFRMYLRQTGAGPQLHYGEFTIAKRASYEEIVNILKSVNMGDRETVRVTFPEGYTLMQFADAMQAAGLCTKDEFIAVTQEADFSDIAFLNELAGRENIFLRLEGFLFPDTYEFFPEEPLEDMVRRMLRNFEAHITDEIYALMAQRGMTLNEVITLASVIQEEAGDVAHMYDVSAVLNNRLAEGSPMPKLECDVSWRYIRVYMGEYFGGVSKVPLALDEAYDLYVRVGLSPGAICNPGAEAIDAALKPTQGSPYYFFVTDELGNYYYAETFAQHTANIAITKEVNASIQK